MKLYSSPSFNNLPLREVQTYTEDEIAELFDLSEEESVELTKVISNQVAINKVYSSQKTEERLAEILTEANQFATEQLGKSNFLSIDIVTSVDEIVDEHILYLIADESGTNTYNQYVLINGEVKSLGSTSIDLTNYVTNEKLNEKLEDYAKKNEVIKTDDITTTIDKDNPSNAKVPTEKSIVDFTKDLSPKEDYIEDEIVIGTWFGKPLYRKCINAKGLTLANENTYIINSYLTNSIVSEIVNITGGFKLSNNTLYTIPYSNSIGNYSLRCFISNEGLYIHNKSGGELNECCIIVEYTKA